MAVRIRPTRLKFSLASRTTNSDRDYLGKSNMQKTQITWSLTDLRRWWIAPVRYRWMRSIGLAPARELTNFGDLK
jgi:hypothetical protein